MLEVEDVVVGDLAERTFMAIDVKCKFRESLISLGSMHYINAVDNEFINVGRSVLRWKYFFH